MDSTTIQAWATMLTALGIGTILPKVFDALRVLFTGGVKRRRNEIEKLRAAVAQKETEIATLTQLRIDNAVMIGTLTATSSEWQARIDRLRAELGKAHARIARLLNVNRDLRIAAERNELLLERAGITPAVLPDIDEDTDGPWSSEMDNS